MPITDRQREQRRNHIGASDTPPICGVGYGNIADVWAGKVNELEPDTPMPWMETGNRLEGVLVTWAAERLDVRVRRNQSRVSADDRLFAANHDALVGGDHDEGIEAKYVGQYAADAWGEAETDQVPSSVFLQCQHQCYVSELSLVWVPTLIVNRSADFRMYQVRRNDDVIKAIVERGRTFWQTCVLAGKRPEGPPPTLDVLKRIKREPDKVLADGELAADLVERMQTEAAIATAAKNRSDQAKAAVIEALGDAEAAVVGGQLVTYLETQRKGYTAEATTYRQLRVKERTNG